MNANYLWNLCENCAKVLNSTKKENQLSETFIIQMLDSKSRAELTENATNVSSCIKDKEQKLIFCEWMKNINITPWRFLRDEDEQGMGFDGEYICKLTKFLYAQAISE